MGTWSHSHDPTGNPVQIYDGSEEEGCCGRQEELPHVRTFVFNLTPHFSPLSANGLKIIRT